MADELCLKYYLPSKAHKLRINSIRRKLSNLHKLVRRRRSQKKLANVMFILSSVFVFHNLYRKVWSIPRSGLVGFLMNFSSNVLLKIKIFQLQPLVGFNCSKHL